MVIIRKFSNQNFSLPPTNLPSRVTTTAYPQFLKHQGVTSNIAIPARLTLIGSLSS